MWPRGGSRGAVRRPGWWWNESVRSCRNPRPPIALCLSAPTTAVSQTLENSCIGKNSERLANYQLQEKLCNLKVPKEILVEIFPFPWWAQEHHSKERKALFAHTLCANFGWNAHSLGFYFVLVKTRKGMWEGMGYTVGTVLVDTRKGILIFVFCFCFYRGFNTVDRWNYFSVHQ